MTRTDFLGLSKREPNDKYNLAENNENLDRIDLFAQTIATGIVGIPVEETGVSISLTDASNNNLKNLVIYGNTTQAGTPTPEAPVDLVSVENPIVTISTYEPYKSQTLSIPYTLNGVGDVRDYVDFEKGVKVSNVTFDNITNIAYSYIANWNASTDYVQLNYNVSGRKGGNVLCSHFTRNGNVAGANGVGIYFTGSVLIFGCKKSMLEEYGAVTGDSASYRTAFIAWWNAQKEAETPVKVMLELATPTETPLTAEEIEAFKQLTSYYPTTTITNSENVEMGVEYFADTKIYIDNKFAEINRAILNNI